MKLLLILLAAVAALLAGYLLYGRWLAKTWGLDPARETPSQDCFDGKDYVPTPPAVVLGHHFASIAGAGTIIGTVKAAAFGWLPVLMWIVVGGVFFAAAHDFGALFASLRHKGRSLGRVLREHVGEKAQRLFTVYALLVLVLLVACFTNIIADTFASPAAVGLVSVGMGQVSPQAGAGVASILFTLVGLLFGLLVFRKNLPMIPMIVLCLALMAASVWAGLNLGLNLPYWIWVGLIAVYLVAASLAPVWALLQPRDFLSSFLLWGMMLFSLVVLLIPHGAVPLTASTAVIVSDRGALFSVLYVLVFSGAVSGYNALIASGTTSKQLANEKHARAVSVGSVALNALLALIVLLAVLRGIPETEKLSPFDAFAYGVAAAAGKPVVYSLLLMTAATFAFTTLDTCTRLARYLFAELFNPDNRRLKKLEGAQRFFATPAVGTVILVLLGCGLGLVRGLDRLWGLFGAANLLLAGLAMMTAAIWLRGEGKRTAMLVVPMFVTLATAIGYLVWSAVLTLQLAALRIEDWLSLGCSAVLTVLTVILLVQGLPALFMKKPEAADDAD